MDLRATILDLRRERNLWEGAATCLDDYPIDRILIRAGAQKLNLAAQVIEDALNNLPPDAEYLFKKAGE